MYAHLDQVNRRDLTLLLKARAVHHDETAQAVLAALLINGLAPRRGEAHEHLDAQRAGGPSSPSPLAGRRRVGGREELRQGRVECGRPEAAVEALDAAAERHGGLLVRARGELARGAGLGEPDGRGRGGERRVGHGDAVV